MYLLFDIGGTKMRAAFSSDGKKIFQCAVLETPKNFNVGLVVLSKLARELGGGKKIKAVAGGVAGMLDKKRLKLIGARNLPGWAGKPLVKEIQKKIGAPVFLENDAALAGLGEATFGAGRGSKILGYVTVSTGVGGARIVDGKIDKKTLGFEPGKQIVHQGKTLEWFISGADIRRRTGKDPEKIRDRATQDKLAQFLATGLNNSIAFWSPDTIVVGGSVMKIIPFDRVIFHFRQIFKFRSMNPPRIKKAALGDKSGLYGALVYLKQQLGKKDSSG